MNCEVVRQHLLESERPERPTNGAARHLLSCPACRAWHYRLTRLERQLAHLPAPASEPPAALLEMLRRAGPVLVRPPLSGEHPAARAREFGRRKLALAASLAAALAVFAVGLWALPRPVTPVPLSAMAQLKLQDHRLAAANTPQAEVAVLADMAESALAEAAKKLDDPARLRALADRFDLIVKDALLAQAAKVPADQRGPILSSLAKRLGGAESMASRLASEAAGRPAASVAALTRIAATAHAADVRLRELAARRA
jgi:hypothetical protein